MQKTQFHCLWVWSQPKVTLTEITTWAKFLSVKITIGTTMMKNSGYLGSMAKSSGSLVIRFLMISWWFITTQVIYWVTLCSRTGAMVPMRKPTATLKSWVAFYSSQFFWSLRKKTYVNSNTYKFLRMASSYCIEDALLGANLTPIVLPFFCGLDTGPFFGTYEQGLFLSQFWLKSFYTIGLIFE